LPDFADAEAYRLLETFQEVETGKGADTLDRRPQLAGALKSALLATGATGLRTIADGLNDNGIPTLRAPFTTRSRSPHLPIL